MEGIRLKVTCNVFANVVRELRVFSRLLLLNDLFRTYRPLNASVGSIFITTLGGPERSAGSLGVVMKKRVSAAYSNLELDREVPSIFRRVADEWNRIIKDTQCQETSVCLTMTRSQGNEKICYSWISFFGFDNL